MQTFQWQPGPRIVSGVDAIDSIGEIAQQLAARRVLIVSDAGVSAAGHVDRAKRSLVDCGAAVSVIDDVHQNPSTLDVAAGVEAANKAKPDLLIGLGGGSAMDCAKGINFVYTNGGQLEDYWGFGKAGSAMLPMIAVPTTAGTGSEVQSYALIARAQDHRKMACGDRQAMPRVAILDPRLLLTTPSDVAALSTIDAVSHAVEAYVTTKGHAISRMYSRESFRLLAASVVRLQADVTDLAAWSTRQWGACLAGMAIENSMLGAAHALANPLTANYGIVHGRAVGVMLPHVVRFNLASCQEQYAELMALVDGKQTETLDLATWLTQLLEAYSAATTLRALGVPQERLPQLSDEAEEQWTARFNPRTLTRADALALYQTAY